jgi:hypothetical protein
MKKKSVSWTSTKLEEAQQRAAVLQRTLTEQQLGAPGSGARTSRIETCLGELRAIENDLLAIEVAAGANGQVTSALLAVARDRARIEPFAGEADPPGVLPDMTWAEAFRRRELMANAQALNDEITAQVQPGADDPLGTLFRSDGPHQAAQTFARAQLAGRIEELMAVARRYAAEVGEATMAERFPGFEYKTADPPPEFQLTVRELIRQLAAELFPVDGGYVTGDLFDMLVLVYAHARESLGGDLDVRATRVTLVDLLFLRGQLAALASFAASLPRGTVAGETLMRTVAILMTAANGSGQGKIPSGYRPELDALHFYVDAFMSSTLGRLAAAAPSGNSDH